MLDPKIDPRILISFLWGTSRRYPPLLGNRQMGIAGMFGIWDLGFQLVLNLRGTSDPRDM